jgi:hypothetical protein
MFLRNVGCFQLTTWCYIPEDRTLHNRRCDNISVLEGTQIPNYGRRSALGWAAYDESRQQNTWRATFRNYKTGWTQQADRMSESYKPRGSRSLEREVGGQQVTQLPDSTMMMTMIMIWSLSAACIDMRLLASGVLPFHVKASTKKVVNNSEPRDPAEARLECWQQRGLCLNVGMVT